MSITARQIWTNTNASVTPTSDTCNVPLASNQTCAYTLSPTSNLAYSCRVFAIGNDGNLSGIVEIQNSSHAVLVTTPLHK
jgi:hypothetical protein